MPHPSNENTKWKKIFWTGGVAAISAVIVGVIEIGITFLPGGNTIQETVLDWFVLFQENWFLGLRNLGLLNILLNTLAILTYFALYTAFRKSEYQPYAALATIIAFLGVAVFFSTNRAFGMLALSNQYAAATTSSQRATIEAAGQSLLAVGESHTPGTFLAFILSEIAGIMISVVMLQSKIFSKATAYAGILGFGILLIFEFTSSFVVGLSGVTMAFAMVGGILSMIWYILVARRFFEIAKR